MRREDARRLLAVLDGAKVHNSKLAYALARSRAQLKGIVRGIETWQKDAQSDEVTEYLKGREELILEHAKRDDTGNLIAQGSGVALKDAEAFRKASSQYDVDHAEAKAKHEAQEQAFQDYLAEEVKLERWTVDAERLPSEMSVDEAELFLEILDQRDAAAKAEG